MATSYYSMPHDYLPTAAEARAADWTGWDPVATFSADGKTRIIKVTSSNPSPVATLKASVSTKTEFDVAKSLEVAATAEVIQ